MNGVITTASIACHPPDGAAPVRLRREDAGLAPAQRSPDRRLDAVPRRDDVARPEVPEHQPENADAEDERLDHVRVDPLPRGGCCLHQAPPDRQNVLVVEDLELVAEDAEAAGDDLEPGGQLLADPDRKSVV